MVFLCTPGAELQELTAINRTVSSGCCGLVSLRTSLSRLPPARRKAASHTSVTAFAGAGVSSLSDVVQQLNTSGVCPMHPLDSQRL